MGATNGAGTACPSEAPMFTPVFNDIVLFILQFSVEYFMNNRLSFLTFLFCWTFYCLFLYLQQQIIAFKKIVYLSTKSGFLRVLRFPPPLKLTAMI